MFLAAVRQVVAPQVDLVAEVGGAADDREEDYEREERGEAHGCWLLWLLSCWDVEVGFSLLGSWEALGGSAVVMVV